MVLCRRPDHRRSANVDVLDRLVESGTAGDRPFEGVEIDGEKVDPADPLLTERGHVGLHRPSGQQSAVDLRVQGLDPAAEDLPLAGDIGNPGDGEPGIGECRCRPAGRDQFHTPFGEPPGEVDDTGLVRDREKGAADRRWGHGGDFPKIVVVRHGV